MNPEDRLIDALLREHARAGNHDDTLFLQKLEASITAEKDKSPGNSSQRRQSNWVMSLGLAASVLLAAFLTWKMFPSSIGEPMGSDMEGTIASNDKDLVPLNTEVPRPLSVGTPKDISGLLTRSDPAATRQMRAPAAPMPMKEALSQERSTMPSLNGAALGSAQPVDRERYGQWIDNPWRSPADEVFSTFSIDVDTASYSNFRRLARSGARIPSDAIRLEEMVNYFDYTYPQPDAGVPFSVQVDSAVTPWNPETRLVRVALRGREVVRTERVPANLVFLLDVSGSMADVDKLPLVAQSFQLLLEEMNAADTVSIVVYAGAEGLALPPTNCDSAGRERIAAALKNLQAGGSTNGGAGIQLAYKLARENFKQGGINRVILATDGDFNVGVTEDGGLVSMVEKNAKSNVFLTVLGFGTGNLNDGMLEAITNKGNGTYHYIDGLAEGRRVFLQKMMGTLLTIAKDVKIQVEFNPAMVAEYRLLGYANRILNKEDFNNDRVDAGDIGAGHTVTAFYEIKPGPARPSVDAPRYAKARQPAPVEDLSPAASGPADPAVAASAATMTAPALATLAEPANAGEWLTVKLRYKAPEGDSSKLIEKPFTGEDKAFDQTDEDFRFATAVAMAASVLRETGDFGSTSLRQARDVAAAAKGNDPHGLRAEFVDLLDRLLSSETERPRE